MSHISFAEARRLKIPIGVRIKREKSKTHSVNVKARQAKERGSIQLLVMDLAKKGVPRPHRNHVIDGTSKAWQYDLAWPDRKIAVELQGVPGHLRLDRFTEDCLKSSEAAALGWTVMPFVHIMVEDGRAATLIAARYLLGELE